MTRPDDLTPLGLGEGSLAAELGGALMEFELAPMPMFLLLPEGRLLKANRAVREMLGWESGDEIGVDVHDLVDPTDRGTVSDRLRDVLRHEGATPEVTTNITGADGRRHRVRSSSLTVRDDAGVPRYIIARVLETT